MHPHLPARRDRLAHRVLERLGPDGLIHAPCAPRVLETALLLTLLNKENLTPDGVGRARRYLKRTLNTDPPDALQCAFAHAALGGAPIDVDTTVHAALAAFDHFSGPRKLLTFQTLLTEVTDGRHPHHLPAAEFGTTHGHQAWLQLQMLALKAMATPHLATRDDWSRLTVALQPGPPWQANHLARLQALLALRKNPAHRDAVRQTLLRIAAELRPDAGLPFVTGLDVFATAVAGLALTRALPADPRIATMAETLTIRQNPDGGFGFTSGVTQSDVDDTSYAIEFLRAAAPLRHAPSITAASITAASITAAEEYLLAQRNPDGGFPTFSHGAPSEIAMTAGAINALASNPARRPDIERAVAFLLQAGHPIERSWSRTATNALYRTTLALAGLTPSAPAPLRSAAHIAHRSAIRHLIDIQEPDGGWGHEPGDTSDPISTSYAVIALTTQPAPVVSPALHRALDRLLAAQQPDAGYTSRADQAGPRPLLYDIPALADIFALLALSTAPGHRDKP
ncbi:prenyltransferase/squalene oxidase repeat-containing protein [Nonomuraea sp. NPDC050404]|uniref:prenyltransferase/squalene oxidase repeat-containing protein n=1 Tax=Nonomuraea sp. NPDC050404 TaxID=3155783 RepID=UPI0033D409D1